MAFTYDLLSILNCFPFEKNIMIFCSISNFFSLFTGFSYLTMYYILKCPQDFGEFHLSQFILFHGISLSLMVSVTICI